MSGGRHWQIVEVPGHSQEPFSEGDWNAILDPKIDKIGRGANRLGMFESSLAGFMTRHGLVDRFHLDHPGREMWTWLDRSPSAKVGSYLDRVLVRRADIEAGRRRRSALTGIGRQDRAS